MLTKVLNKGLATLSHVGGFRPTSIRFISTQTGKNLKSILDKTGALHLKQGIYSQYANVALSDLEKPLPWLTNTATGDQLINSQKDPEEKRSMELFRNVFKGSVDYLQLHLITKDIRINCARIGRDPGVNTASWQTFLSIISADPDLGFPTDLEQLEIMRDVLEKKKSILPLLLKLNIKSDFIIYNEVKGHPSQVIIDPNYKLLLSQYLLKKGDMIFFSPIRSLTGNYFAHNEDHTAIITHEDKGLEGGYQGLVATEDSQGHVVPINLDQAGYVAQKIDPKLIAMIEDIIKKLGIPAAKE